MAIAQEMRVYYAVRCDQCDRLAAWCETAEKAREIAARDFGFKTVPLDWAVLVTTTLCPACASEVVAARTQRVGEEE